jgi:ATP-dependent Clp protease ATP-binding subunit ClpB
MQDRYTIKSREALEAAARIVDDLGHAQLDTEHILAALVRQEDGIVPHLLSRLGVTPSQLDADLNGLLSSKPRGLRRHRAEKHDAGGRGNCEGR